MTQETVWDGHIFWFFGPGSTEDYPYGSLVAFDRDTGLVMPCDISEEHRPIAGFVKKAHDYADGYCKIGVCRSSAECYRGG